ncbi:hypothetical protein IJE86_02920 [bacterium]|nr:hypothetical protein [bacterium]
MKNLNLLGGGEIRRKQISNFNKFPRLNKKIAFSIAEALITLAIVGVAMSSAAPLISKTMKNSQVGNFQIMRINRDLDSIRKDITNIKNNYVSKSYLTQVLANYVTTATLNSTLSNYVTNTALKTRLNNYVTTNTLANYATINDIANFLTAGDLNGYATTATLNQQVSNLSEQIAALRTQLANAQGVPTGTIAFFASDRCPTGWSKVSDTYNGRFPRFAGQYTISGHGDTAAITTTLNVGTTQEDAIRNITGTGPAFIVYGDQYYVHWLLESGAMYHLQRTGTTKIHGAGNLGNGTDPNVLYFDASRVVPTASENRPKSIALLGCKKDPN